MNQEKIGKFIQELRKEKGLTQQELASKLNVTDRAVSKWENGRGLPDLSLIKPLSEELDISINELLSGEKLNKKEYSDRLEENIEKTIEYGNDKIKSLKDKIKVFFIVIVTIIFLVLVDTFQAILFKNSPIIGLKNDFLADVDSFVDEGILVDTYYCVKEKDIVSVYVKFKTAKFDCPIDEVEVCSLKPGVDSVMDFEESQKMSMVIKEGTLSSGGATVIIKDLNNQNYGFGAEYRIDVFENGEWREVQVEMDDLYGWNSIGYFSNSEGVEFDIKWSWLYGELKSGHYRIVKSIMPKLYLYEYFSCEFDIE